MHLNTEGKAVLLAGTAQYSTVTAQYSTVTVLYSTVVVLKAESSLTFPLHVRNVHTQDTMKPFLQYTTHYSIDLCRRECNIVYNSCRLNLKTKLAFKKSFL